MAKRINESGKLLWWIGGLLGVVLFILSTGVMCGASRSGQRLNHFDLIKMSRESCVRVCVNSKKQHGSGFFIDPNLVVTCFHVITDVLPVDPNIEKLDLTRWRPYPDITIVTANGEEIAAECVSVPTKADLRPLACDFAVLRLKSKSKGSCPVLPLCEDTTKLIVGDDVYFSGFPLGAPAMLTHKGMLSGLAQNSDRLCIQAPVNKGNSGGAVVNMQGEVIGVISSREGGITKELDRARKTIDKLEGRNVISVTLGNAKVDYLQVDKEVINILDRYISTGIGYARNISCARDYISEHGLMQSGGGKK